MRQHDGQNDLAIIRDQIHMLELAEGFLQSSVLFALLKLRIFERIGDDTRTLPDLAAELTARPETLARLLNAGVVLKLLETKDGFEFALAPAVRSVLSPLAGDQYLGNWIRNLDYFRVALARLDEAVLLSAPTVDPTAHLGADQAQTREFTLAMHNYAALRGRELARYLDTTQSKTLLDLGCGPGTYAFHLGLRNPELHLYLLDLPGVLEVAREVQQHYPLHNQVSYLPLDAFRDQVPGVYDLILVSNTLHMLGDQASRTLIQRLYNSVSPGGSLVIQAQFLRDDLRGERWPIMLDLIQLCTTPHGRNHSVKETQRWMEQSGFSSVEFCPMTVLNTNSFLRGYKR
jgi:predicted TPR repeat methyltransferase